MSSNMNDAKPEEPPESQHEEGEVYPRPEVNIAGLTSAQVAGIVRADNVEIRNGVALAVFADEVEIEKGFSLVTAGRGVSVGKAGSQWLVAGDAHLEQSGAGIMIARHVELTDSKVAVVLAASVSGNVQAVLDPASAVRFGAAFGAILGVALIAKRLIFGR